MVIIVCVNTDTIARLLELNRLFYQTFARPFSDTRQRIQPGVVRVLADVPKDADVLDLGCGNGELARRMAQEGFCGQYVGVDFSAALLDEARRQQTPPLRARFLHGDLVSGGWEADLRGLSFGYAFAFAVLHHLPGFETRLKVVRTLREFLVPGGVFVHSHWHFLNSPRWRARIQPWEQAGISPDEVEAGDYLLDWRQGGHGLRYVHFLDEDELQALANQGGFTCRARFSADGREGNLAHYQVWQATV
ncbi:MAG: hypothetical protein Fur0018_05180 [Anaerolineales bacterium]